MASDSQTATATMSEKPLENKVNEEANLMEKEIVLVETEDVVKDKMVSDSILTVDKEERIDQTPAGEPEKEIPSEVEEAAAVVKTDESTDKAVGENGEEKVAEQVELKEPTLVKEDVTEVNVLAEDENGEEKIAEPVEVNEPTLVKESAEEVVDAEKAGEKLALESVVEEENKGKEEKKMVDVSESTDEAGGKQVEPVDVQLVGQVSEETVEDRVKDIVVLEDEPKPETSEKVEAQPEKAKELAPEAEVVRTEETPETTEQAKVELEDGIVETKNSSINSKDDEQTSESGSTLCPKETVPINQVSDTAHTKETEGDASSLPDVTEKAITEEKQVVEEPSKDEKENVIEDKKDEKITKDTETPATAEGKSGETLKETATESKEGNKQEESITEKVAEVVEAATVVQEIDELKQEPEVTTEEVSVKPKHSNSIMSKVKQSLVKAKKAIIGKSPSSKTITTEETKEEVKAK
ncbi:Neurofilament protein-like protein [Hirschfeldia incana]|nr:Neurofilament protein-like protein [Hirschfeldia incana]